MEGRDEENDGNVVGPHHASSVAGRQDSKRGETSYRP